MVCAFALGLIYTGEPLQVMEQEARGVETVLQVSQTAAPPSRCWTPRSPVLPKGK